MNKEETINKLLEFQEQRNQINLTIKNIKCLTLIGYAFYGVQLMERLSNQYNNLKAIRAFCKNELKQPKKILDVCFDLELDPIMYFITNKI